MDPKSDQFKERFAELKEDVLSHVSEEGLNPFNCVESFGPRPT